MVAGDELGPLHGVPTAIKDLFDFKPGWKSTFGGLPVLADFVIDAYCVFAERIERAGAIIVGKTNSPVMGFRGTCDNYLFGPTHNPFDTSKNSGGSSGGSAAAVGRRTAVVRRRHRRWRFDPDPCGLVRNRAASSRRGVACRRSCGPMRSPAPTRSWPRDR